MDKENTQQQPNAVIRFGLTPRQSDCLRFIASYLADKGGVCPSYEEIRVALNLQNKSGVSRLVNGLVDRGFIRRLPNQTRSISIVKE